jgi:hypothetical protein
VRGVPVAARFPEVRAPTPRRHAVRQGKQSSALNALEMSDIRHLRVLSNPALGALPYGHGHHGLVAVACCHRPEGDFSPTSPGVAGPPSPPPASPGNRLSATGQVKDPARGTGQKPARRPGHRPPGQAQWFTRDISKDETGARMRPVLRDLTAVAAITCALGAAGPVAQAVAAAPPSTGTPLLPGLSCSTNQGLPPGIPNLGPTGPLGPLGPSGPNGGNNSNLPCGLAAFNFGPGGPLGPGGALASPQSAGAQGAAAAPTSASQGSSKTSGNSHKRTGKHRHPGHSKAHKGSSRHHRAHHHARTRR